MSFTRSRDGGRLIGRAITTKWRPEDLALKTELEAELIARGYEGMRLEMTALGILAVRHNVRPLERLVTFNTLVDAGRQIMLDLLIGAGGTVFSNANAALGFGDSATAYAAGQTNLQGAATPTNRIRKAMDATFPSRAANVLTFRATFATTDANFHIQEWALFNQVADPGGTMLNRAVQDLGTKTSAQAWQQAVTLTQS